MPSRGFHRRDRATRRRGSALVLALIVVSMVAALGAGYLRIATAVTRRQTGEVESVRAFYLAEAGLAEAFQAVRVGRSGQLGSEEAPAVYGDGLLWVDATDTADGQARLVSTALCGSGRATLSYVVEPVEIPLGFFSDEDLVVESVLLVDGFDSEEATYEETVGGLPFISPDPSDIVYDNTSVMVVCITEGAGDMFYDYAYQDGGAYYYVDSVPRGGTLAKTFDARDYFDSKSAEDPATAAVMGGHTGSGGLLGSNGSVVFTLPGGEPVEIYGDVVPGPDGTVEGLGGVFVSGDSEPRSAPIELPAVEVPVTAMAPAVRHDGVLPMLVSAGTSGHSRIEVAPDAELVLRGPATVVIGELILEPGALLTLDTRDGDVELYVTVGMDLQPGSVVTTSSELPEELSVQVAPIPSGPGGAPVKLDATSAFHGTVYAPETEVYVGSDFEVYGGVVARKLEFGPGAKLHFDNAENVATAIPRIVSWQIVEIPAAVRGRRGDPFEALGVERTSLTVLSESHDLAAVALTIDYLDHGDNPQSYSGPEDAFDWDRVAEVVKVERTATRTQEDPGATGDGENQQGTEEPPPSLDEALLDQIHDSSLTSSEVASALLDAGLVSEAVLLEAIRRTPTMDVQDLYNVVEKNGPDVAGYPTAAGTDPLGASLLMALIEEPSFESQYLSWALEQNSPLPPSVLQAAVDRDPPMKTGDLQQVLGAQ